MAGLLEESTSRSVNVSVKNIGSKLLWFWFTIVHLSTKKHEKFLALLIYFFCLGFRADNDYEKRLPKEKLYMVSAYEPLQQWVRKADYTFYQALVEVLIPDVLRPIPSESSIYCYCKKISWLIYRHMGLELMTLFYLPCRFTYTSH